MPLKFEKAIRFLIALTFFVPLIVIPSSFIFPFIVPKILIFRSLALLMLGCYVILLVANWKKYKPEPTALNVIVLIFFLSFSLSTFVGVDWYKSFWDNHERMLGLFTIFHFVVYYFIATSVIKEWRDWRWLLHIFLGAGIIVMGLGFIQKINPEFLLNRGSGRVSATLGNAIYYSGYGLFLFYIGLLLFLKEENRLKKYYGALGALAGFLGIFIGGTRGTIMALVVSIPVLLVCYLTVLGKNKKTKIFLLAATALILFLTGLAIVFRKTAFVAQIPGINRFLTTDFTGGDTGGTRLKAWGIAVEAWKEKPVFGWGPNNYYYAFNKFYRPEFLESGWGETWFDNAHSAVFNTLAVQGTLGLLSYVGIFAVAFIGLLKAFKAKKIDAHIMAISIAFLIGHFVHNFFVFENPTSYLFFFFFLAFINSETLGARSELAASKGEKRKIPLGVSVTVGAAVFLLIYATDINPARANTATLRSIQSMYANPASGEAVYARLPSLSSPHIDDIRNDLSRTVMQTMTVLMQNDKMEEAKKIFTIAYDELHQNRVLHPLDIRVHIQQAQLAGVLAQRINSEKLAQEVEKVLDEALSYSPKRQQIQYMLAMIKLQLGKRSEAVTLLKDSIDNDPKIEEGWWRLALTYKESGEDAKAEEILKEAKEKGIVFSEQGQSVASLIMNAKKK